MSAPPPASTAGQPRTFHRPIGVAILSVLVMLAGIIVALVGLLALLALGFVGFLVAGPLGGLLGAAFGFVLIIIGGLTYIAGHGLWRMRGWAWWLTVILLIIDVLFGTYTPYGWLIPAVLLLYLFLVRKHFNT